MFCLDLEEDKMRHKYLGQFPANEVALETDAKKRLYKLTQVVVQYQRTELQPNNGAYCSLACMKRVSKGVPNHLAISQSQNMF